MRSTTSKPLRTVGVICEFNPFHNGHAYLLSEAHKMADCVVCVMSGRTIQRGTPAIADPYLRAQTAICGGADLVVELPFPWSSGSAAYFAAAGVHILTALGVDGLLFGSECGSLPLLRQAAEAVRATAFLDRYTALCREGMGTAAAYRQALQESIDTDGLGANDLLGVAYLDAVATQKSPLSPYTVRRLGDGYHETDLHRGTYPSATALRERMVATSEWQTALEGTMPAACLEQLLTAARNGDAPIGSEPMVALAHAALRLSTSRDLSDVAELSGGLGDRMIKQALSTVDGDSFFNSLRTRLYPDARLYRGMLFALTRTRPEDLAALPTYTTVLAATSVGCAFLSALRREDGGLTVVTKAADAPEGRQKELTHRADALCSLCLPRPRHAGWLMQKSPYIKKETNV